MAPDLTVAADIFRAGGEIRKKGFSSAGWAFWLRTTCTGKPAEKELERVGIAMPGPSRTVSQLSGGQRQAVAIAWLLLGRRG